MKIHAMFAIAAGFLASASGQEIRIYHFSVSGDLPDTARLQEIMESSAGIKGMEIFKGELDDDGSFYLPGNSEVVPNTNPNDSRKWISGIHVEGRVTDQAGLRRVNLEVTSGKSSGLTYSKASGTLHPRWSESKLELKMRLPKDGWGMHTMEPDDHGKQEVFVLGVLD